MLYRILEIDATGYPNLPIIVEIDFRMPTTGNVTILVIRVLITYSIY